MTVKAASSYYSIRQWILSPMMHITSVLFFLPFQLLYLPNDILSLGKGHISFDFLFWLPALLGLFVFIFDGFLARFKSSNRKIIVYLLIFKNAYWVLFLSCCLYFYAAGYLNDLNWYQVLMVFLAPSSFLSYHLVLFFVLFESYRRPEVIFSLVPRIGSFIFFLGMSAMASCFMLLYSVMDITQILVLSIVLRLSSMIQLAEGVFVRTLNQLQIEYFRLVDLERIKRVIELKLEDEQEIQRLKLLIENLENNNPRAQKLLAKLLKIESKGGITSGNGRMTRVKPYIYAALIGICIQFGNEVIGLLFEEFIKPLFCLVFSIGCV